VRAWKGREPGEKEQMIEIWGGERKDERIR